jgi:hypothetical protein
MQRLFSVQKLAMLIAMTIAYGAAAQAPATARNANLLIADSETWRTDLAVVAGDEETTLRVSDCIGFGALTTVHLPVGGGKLVPKIARYQCTNTTTGVIKLPIVSGTPRLWTQATYRDPFGNQNVVMIPELPAPLPASYTTTDPDSSVTAEYVFDGIENASAFGKSTFLALTPDTSGKTTVTIDVYSYADISRPIATETVEVDAFTFYELTTPLEFGRLIVKHAPSADDSKEKRPKLFAVAFAGYRAGGSPRVELPLTRLSVTAEGK